MHASMLISPCTTALVIHPTNRPFSHALLFICLFVGLVGFFISFSFLGWDCDDEFLLATITSQFIIAKCQFLNHLGAVMHMLISYDRSMEALIGIVCLRKMNLCRCLTCMCIYQSKGVFHELSLIAISFKSLNCRTLSIFSCTQVVSSAC